VTLNQREHGSDDDDDDDDNDTKLQEGKFESHERGDEQRSIARVLQRIFGESDLPGLDN
jgi:hypothetical protein